MKKILYSKNIAPECVNNSYSTTVEVEGDSIAIANNFDVQSPSALVAASASNISLDDWSFSKTAHGFFTGTKVQIATSDTLPSGLSALTDYWIIKISSSKIALASSEANAFAGTSIEFSDVGVGDQTITAVALSGASWLLQYSLDGILWFDVGTANAITVDASSYYEKLNPSYKMLRIKYAITAGQVAAESTVLIKGEVEA